MSTEADGFSIRLLDEAKRFLEKAKAETGSDQDAYLHAALMVGFSALESHLNGIADELAGRPNANLLNSSVLLEKEAKLDGGVWVLGKEKFFRLDDRIAFLTAEYSKVAVSSYSWWSVLREGIKVRNSLVHPREALVLKPADVERFLSAILGALNDIYLGIFRKGHPSFNRGLQSTMTF